MQKLVLVALVIAGCSNDQVTTSSQVFGTWDRKLTDASLTIARKVALNDDLTFTMEMDDGTMFMGTWEVNNLFVLCYPAAPANTTWCVPNATRDGNSAKFDDFNSDCGTSPHPPGLQSPLDGEYDLETP
jgi:hypothetical protein